MNGFFLNKDRSAFMMAKLFLGDKLKSGIILSTLLVPFFLLSPAQASQLPVEIVNTWVEDGFLFHVTFKAQPAKADCSLKGEGLIEFEVVYDTLNSSGAQSVFGVARWSHGSNTDSWIETQGKAIGAQSLCTTFSPCGIQQVNIVKAWCPVDGPNFLK